MIINIILREYFIIPLQKRFNDSIKPLQRYIWWSFNKISLVKKKQVFKQNTKLYNQLFISLKLTISGCMYQTLLLSSYE